MKPQNQNPAAAEPTAPAAPEAAKPDAQAGAAPEAGQGEGEPSALDRILKEANEWKKRAKDAEKAMNAQKKAEDEQKGEYKKLWESEKSRNENLVKGLMNRDVKSAVAGHGQKFGLVDAEALMKLAGGDMLQYDPETGAVDGVEAFIESNRAKYPYLFNAAKQPSINTSIPGGKVSQKVITADDIAKMSEKDRMAYMMQLMSKS